MAKDKQVGKKTSTIPPPKRIYKKFEGIKDGVPFGHPNNPQPTGEAKSLGKLRKKTGMELAKAILNLTFNDIPVEDGLKQKVADFYGIPVEDVTIEVVLHYKQIEKAGKGDTYAYATFMNRALGMPKQVTEEIGKGTTINVNIEGEGGE